jgi:hypothetical protein
MNTDSADTRFPHLDLEDLIAGAAGQPVGDRAREHLAGCEHCQLEASRWNLVAGGVRGLAAAAPESAQAAPPRRTARRVLTGHGRRAIFARSAAAAVVLLGAGFGVFTALGGHVSVSTATGTTTAVTAVIGCDSLEQVTGTLEQVNGSSLAVRTPSGQLVTVTTADSKDLSASGTVASASGALLSGITDGAQVLVAGASSDGRIAADLVGVGGNPSFSPPPSIVAVKGTVADAGATGFTVVTSAGSRVPVTTSGGTDVVIFRARLDQMQVGSAVIAVGHAEPHGTVSALVAVQPPSWPAGAHGSVTVRVRDCSPASIDHVVVALGI